MNNKFTIISFYTPKYKIEAAYLKRSLTKLNIPFLMKPVKNKTWQNACAYKSKFIKKQLKKLKSPVIWLDADAYVYKYPALFDYLNCDFSARFIKDKSFFNEEKILSSTLFFNYTNKSMLLLDSWIEKCINNPKIFDQDHLTEAFYEHQNSLTCQHMPKEYSLIINEITSTPIDQIVILQTQASRLLSSMKENKASNLDLELMRLYRTASFNIKHSEEAQENFLYWFFLDKTK